MKLLSWLVYSLILAPLQVLANPINVMADQLDCVLDNAETYLAKPDDTLVILLGSCPESDFGAILFGSAQNNAAVVIDKRDDSLDSPAEVIVLSKSELLCLIRQRDALLSGKMGTVVQIDPSTCE